MKYPKKGVKVKDGATELLEKLYRTEKFRGFYENLEERPGTQNLEYFRILLNSIPDLILTIIVGSFGINIRITLFTTMEP